MAASLWDSLSLENVFVWIGIALCIAQSAIFSGLNLAIFSVSKLRLEVEAAGGNGDASGLLALRKDSNVTLATVLWGKVAINVLLTLLSDLDPCRLGGVCLLDNCHHAVRRNYSASLFLPKCAAYGGAAHAAAECVPGGTFSDSQAHSGYTQLVARTGRNYLPARARLSRAYYKARGSCGRGRGRVGGYRRTELSRPRRHPCGG